jgi:exodeoxyribonuclease V alpha subunit
LLSEEEVIVEEDRCYLAPFYHAEKGIAVSLRRVLRARAPYAISNVVEAIARVEGQFGIRYEEAQREAIKTAAESKVMVLTGGPGTGKTTITRGIISLFEGKRMRVLLCSPTGRAAKKLSEATGREAKTIHRMLGYNPAQGFERNRNSPLTADAVVVDELSMVDTLLMHNLLKAIPDHAVLILVGDVDQLPSVGAGNVLRDLISSGALPVVRLTHIFRQSQQSQIVINAHRINHGRFPHISNREARDFFFVEEEDPDRIVELIRDLCTRRLPERYRYDPIDDIQVLSPMYKGETGASNLNTVLQEALNPSAVGWQRGGTEYRVGDKVMQVRNNYAKGVFNGDIGRITKMDLEGQSMEAVFDVPVAYEFSELDELVLAYAISVHKSQGSEYRAVIMPLTTQHYMLLQRNLLYTAVTRARDRHQESPGDRREERQDRRQVQRLG